MMDIEKLIHCLQCCARVDAHNIGCDDCGLEYCGPECQQLCGTAATALSTLQAKNKRLNKIVCSIPTTPDSGRTVSQYDKEMSMCAYLDDLEAENEKLRAELEQVKRERDVAIGDIYSGNANDCDTCLHGCDYNNDCPLETSGECKYKWRGLQREN